jgi:glycosyltransferase involved in cell wall biosynthesis
LIKAIPMVVKEHPNIKFILLSGGEEEQFLSNLIRKLGVEEKIDLIGYVDDESYIKYLAASDIIISIPSTDATSISLLEGMAIGLYPIATDIPANREWIRDGENGTLVRVGDFHALAEAILEAVRDGGEHFIKENYNLIKKRANFSHQMQIFEEKYLLRDA